MSRESEPASLAREAGSEARRNLRPRPLVLAVDALVWTGELSRRERRPVRLDEIPDRDLDRAADRGFGWLWLMGAWERGDLSREVARRRVDVLEAAESALAHVSISDIEASPFAIRAYRVPETLGGQEGLEGLRDALEQRGMRLLLDFGVNHVALDHPWAAEHPEYFVWGTESAAAASPRAFHRTPDGLFLAHGAADRARSWTDTLQLDLRSREVEDALIREMSRAAPSADGFFLHGAELVLGGAFSARWRDLPPAGRGPSDPEPGSVSFLDRAALALWNAAPGFVLFADALGDGRELLEAACDYVVDGSYRASVLEGDAGAIRAAIERPLVSTRGRLASLEFPGSERAARVLPPERQAAAGLLSILSLGGTLCMHGQLEGRRARASVHLSRWEAERVDAEAESFFDAVLEVAGRADVSAAPPRLIEARAAWEGNPTHGQYVILSWFGARGSILAVVNHGPARAQGYVPLEALAPAGRTWVFQDLLSVAVYERNGDELAARGLYLDMVPWDYHVFSVSSV